MVFEERDFVDKFRRGNIEEFQSYIESYDQEMTSYLIANGWKCKNKAERTVLFTFGEVRIKRKRWYKRGKCRIPVDDMLGLEKNSRYSKELLFQVSRVARDLPYRKAAKVFENLYGIYITKDTVDKAVKSCAQLLEEKEDYRFFEEKKGVKKIKAERIYLEGDGVWLKTCNPSSKLGYNKEYAHFLVHTGSQEVGKNRFELQNKKEIFAANSAQARDKLLDYLYNHFEIDENTLLITNSDGGRGYSPYVFKEIAQALKIVKHEHFWDKYHIYQDIDTMTKNFPVEVKELFYQSIKTHDKSLLRTAFDTLESLVEEEDQAEKFQVLKRKFLNNFQYTKPAELRGLSNQGIGVMESQHRKMTYRMKHRGMYWSDSGAQTIGNMLLMSDEELRELFFGSWREDYQQYVNIEYRSIFNQPSQKNYLPPVKPRTTSRAILKTFKKP